MNRLGLTLGGGGARGAAHVGVLTELERLEVRPDLITGTSIGGLIGALLAAGMDVQAIGEFFKQLNVTTLYSLPGKRPSLSSNSKVEKLLEDAIGRITFADLDIPLAVVSTDLVTRQAIVLDEGDLITALLATIALPIVLPPVEREGRFLVDGGLVNNVPFDVATARGASCVIAVDLTNTAPFGAGDEPDAPPAYGLVDRMLNKTHQFQTYQVLSTVVDIVTVQSMNTRLALSKPDLLLRPYLGTTGLLDFHRWESCLKAGKTAVRDHQPDVIFLAAQSTNTERL